MVAQEVQGSRILKAIDSAFPRPPSFLTGVEQIIAGVPYPRVFDAIANPDLPGPVTVDPAIGNDPAVIAAAKETVKIRSLGCGGEVFGSGFPVANDYILSNAHVVGGTHNHRVIIPDGRSLAADVVLFDAQRDVSILHVPGMHLTPLTRGEATRGTSGATIGYPGGGNETVSAAAVRAQVEAIGRDIYGETQVTRPDLCPPGRHPPRQLGRPHGGRQAGAWSGSSSPTRPATRPRVTRSPTRRSPQTSRTA